MCDSWEHRASPVMAFQLGEDAKISCREAEMQVPCQLALYKQIGGEMDLCASKNFT